MTTISPERPAPAPAAPLATASSAAPFPSAGPSKSGALLIGLDLGTNKSCLLVGSAGSNAVTVNKVVPSAVGYVRDGIVDGIITGNARVLFGEEALRQMLHVNLVAPVQQGVVCDPSAARDFLQHLRGLADPSGKAEIRAVVGMPANAEEDARESIRQAAKGIFQRILLIPEPFLAALGFRDDSRIQQPNYVDPVVNSLFIDIGGGTSDLCLVQGYFPRKDDQASIPFAGDSIDLLLYSELARTYPNNGLSMVTVRGLKEAHAYVGAIRKPMDVKLIIGGKARTLELGEMMGRACNQLVDRIYPALVQLIARASSDSVTTLLQNIIVTGGGSQIRGIDLVLQQKLADDGYEAPKVKLAGQDYQRYVAAGALKAARAARDSQWQVLFE